MMRPEDPDVDIAMILVNILSYLDSFEMPGNGASFRSATVSRSPTAYSLARRHLEYNMSGYPPNPNLRALDLIKRL